MKPNESATTKTTGSMGFTLVELIMVVALVGILATLSIPVYNGYLSRTRNSRAMSEVRNLSTELSSYNLDKGYYPDQLTDLRPGPFKDPWKNDYQYYYIFKFGSAGALMDVTDVFALNREYDLYSKGADNTSALVGGTPGNGDDIALSNDGAYVGLREP